MKTSIFLSHRNFRKFWIHPTSSMGWFMKWQHFLQELNILSSPNTVGVLFVFCFNYCTPEVPELLWSWADAGVGGRGDALVLAACNASFGIPAGILFQEGLSGVVSVHLVIKSSTHAAISSAHSRLQLIEWEQNLAPRLLFWSPYYFNFCSQF